MRTTCTTQVTTNPQATIHVCQRRIHLFANFSSNRSGGQRRIREFLDNKRLTSHDDMLETLTDVTVKTPEIKVAFWTEAKNQRISCAGR